ncbi:SusF/SusE family outer membrane protein [Carboxylicivirga caseinilyticus]|uniref:SusF/SusE family outer membrane protein n=1 Tax=Carboxylicivirga caseinilyticus TaxID=3417572 RepID=UPI003D335C4C|nr:SusF/SusE family outer membrane protein [Marinilabiliaceae bacterium A049]
MKKSVRIISFLILGLVSISSAFAQYDYVSIVGDACSVGYDPVGIPLEKNENVFTFNGVLKAGNFKFHTFNGDWCDGDWINSSVADQDLTGTTYIITTGCDGPDNKWSVTTPGSYSITIDLDASTIQIEELTYYANLYLVGDATPGSWDLNMASEMTVDGSNPALFTWSGDLVAGNFKIATAKTFDDGWDWIMPLATGQDFSLSDYQVVLSGGGIDNSWTIDALTEGKYDISVDLQAETINISESTATGISNSDLSQVQAFLNELSGQLNIDLGIQKIATVSVYSITGHIIYQTDMTESIVLDASLLGGPGLKLVQVSNNNFKKVFKILVQ